MIVERGGYAAQLNIEMAERACSNVNNRLTHNQPSIVPSSTGGFGVFCAKTSQGHASSARPTSRCSRAFLSSAATSQLPNPIRRSWTPRSWYLTASHPLRRTKTPETDPPDRTYSKPLAAIPRQIPRAVCVFACRRHDSASRERADGVCVWVRVTALAEKGCLVVGGWEG